MSPTSLQSTAQSCTDGRQENSCGEMDRLQQKIGRLMTRMRIAVIFGSDKTAPGSVLYQTCNTRSWKSYEAVAQDIARSLQRIGFRHVRLMPDDMRLPDRLRREGIHMAWLNTGGVQGYNPAAHASSMLEMLGIPYVGHDPLAATTLDNKHAFKREAVCAGIPTAAFSTWSMARGAFRPELNSRFQAAFGQYGGPFIVKPVSGRASLHVHVAETCADLPEIVASVYRATENVVLIEKYLSGREFCIGVAGPITARQGRLVRNGDPFTLSAIERVFEPEERIFTSMDARPITKDRLKKLDPKADGELLERMRRLACEIYREFNLSSLIRLDMRSDADGNLHVLEANPKPDLKQPAEGVTSLLCAGLADCGMDYDDLILSLMADRLDYLFTHRHEAVGHLLELLDQGSSEAIAPTGMQPLPAIAADQALSVNEHPIDQAIARIQEFVAEINLLALKPAAMASEVPERTDRQQADDVTAKTVATVIQAA